MLLVGGKGVARGRGADDACGRRTGKVGRESLGWGAALCLFWAGFVRAAAKCETWRDGRAGEEYGSANARALNQGG